MYKYSFVSSEEVQKLHNWHQRLNENRADRARLKRAERPEDILLTDVFFRFLTCMGDTWGDEKRIFTSAAVAGLLSHVKSDSERISRIYKQKKEEKQKIMASFAEQLATPLNTKKAPVNEIRFQQLQKSRSTDEFYRCIVRSIRMLGGNVNIASLTNDIIHWHLEFIKQIDREPGKRLAVVWATDYFTTLELLID